MGASGVEAVGIVVGENLRILEMTLDESSKNS
jgi:hypothetical protein